MFKPKMTLGLVIPRPKPSSKDYRQANKKLSQYAPGLENIFSTESVKMHNWLIKFQPIKNQYSNLIIGKS